MELVEGDDRTGREAYVDVLCQHVVRQLVFVDHIVVCRGASERDTEKEAEQPEVNVELAPR